MGCCFAYVCQVLTTNSKFEDHHSSIVDRTIPTIILGCAFLNSCFSFEGVDAKKQNC